MRLMRLERSLAVALLTLVECESLQAETIEFLVPSRIIQTGEQINGEDFTTKMFEVSLVGAARYVTSASQFKGKEAKRILPIGRPVSNSSIGPQVLIRKGQTVEAHFRATGILIEMPLSALEDGSVGSVVMTRNLTTGKKVRARVTANGTVDVLK